MSSIMLCNTLSLLATRVIRCQVKVDSDSEVLVLAEHIPPDGQVPRGPYLLIQHDSPLRTCTTLFPKLYFTRS